MIMSDFIDLFQKHYGIMTFLLTGLGVLIKIYVEFLFNRRSRIFGVEQEKLAAKYKADLEHLAFVNQTKFAQAHLERAKVISTMNKLIVDVLEILQDCETLKDHDVAPNVRKVFFDKGQALLTHFHYHEFYFSKEQASTIRQFLSDLASLFLFRHAIGEEALSEEKRTELKEKIPLLMESVHTIRDFLLDDFRRIIG
jgi:hypothetical protein